MGAYMGRTLFPYLSHMSQYFLAKVLYIFANVCAGQVHESNAIVCIVPRKAQRGTPVYFEKTLVLPICVSYIHIMGSLCGSS